MDYFFAILIAFFISYIITPFIAQVGEKQNLVDKPGFRKIHQSSVPNLGGIVVFFGFLTSVFLVIPLSRNTSLLLAGGLIILLLGIVDDIADLKPRYKFLIQMIPALLFILSHYKEIDLMMTRDLEWLSFLGYLFLPLLMIWIVGVTNAINLIDGLDGLACGISILSLMSLLIIGTWVEQYDVCRLFILSLLGSMLAFFRFNFFPAKMFLGDSGSTLAGYMIAVLGTILVLLSEEPGYFLSLLFILLLPVGDTFFAILRRLKNHKPIFQGDQEHLHHQLIKRGLDHRKTVIVLILAHGLFCFIGLMIAVIIK